MLSRNRDANRLVRGYGVRTITRGKAIAAVQVYEFQPGTPRRVKATFLLEGLGNLKAKARVVRLGGKTATYIASSGVALVIYVDAEDLAFVISGAGEENVRRAAGAVIAAT